MAATTVDHPAATLGSVGEGAVELHDVQGIVIRGYGHLTAARFALVQLTDVPAAKRWLAAVVENNAVTNAAEKPEDRALNVAFTFAGLQELGFDAGALGMFSNEFRDGMTTEHRRRALGDVGENAPENWRWGGPNAPPPHLLLMFYAAADNVLDEFYAAQMGDPAKIGLQLVCDPLETTWLPDGKEHFGFSDGGAQPVIAGAGEQGRPEKGTPENTIRAGEFLLGYVNEYGKLTPRPLLRTKVGAAAELPLDADGASDFGRNGSYLVYRQLEQHVRAFWEYMDSQARDSRERVWLASKTIGRWPSGASLVLAPDEDRPELAKDNDFGYHEADPLGLKCPVGSHVRRANPRDSLDPNPGSQESIDVGKRHRIMRRGRAYGPPVAASMASDDILATPDSGVERGLHFLCFNANIGRQFEFIQQTWINSPKFAGLHGDADPLMGPKIAGETDTLTIPETPVRRRLCGIPQFVRVRGGAYFFMPGICALRYLAALA